MDIAHLSISKTKSLNYIVMQMILNLSYHVLNIGLMEVRNASYGQH